MAITPEIDAIFKECPMPWSPCMGFARDANGCTVPGKHLVTLARACQPDPVEGRYFAELCHPDDDYWYVKDRTKPEDSFLAVFRGSFHPEAESAAEAEAARLNAAEPKPETVESRARDLAETALDAPHTVWGRAVSHKARKLLAAEPKPETVVSLARELAERSLKMHAGDPELNRTARNLLSALEANPA